MYVSQLALNCSNHVQQAFIEAPIDEVSEQVPSTSTSNIWEIRGGNSLRARVDVYSKTLPNHQRKWQVEPCSLPYKRMRNHCVPKRTACAKKTSQMSDKAGRVKPGAKAAPRKRMAAETLENIGNISKYKS